MRIRRNEDGQTIVEFVLMLPFILLLIMALAEFGFAFYTNVTVNNATSEAARFASVGRAPGCDADQVGGRAVTLSNGRLACSSVSVFYADDPPTRGDGVVVRVEHPYRPITPLPALVSLVTGSTVDLAPNGEWPMRSCSDARLERIPDAGTYNSIPNVTCENVPWP